MASPDYSDGCMIALYPPADLAADLAVPDGLEPADMHVTVAYLGSTADVTREAVLAAAQAIAGRKPIEATISGHARFTGGEQDVIVALVDSPDLEDLRRDTLDQLETQGVNVHRDHGYTPHLSINYVEPDAASPVDRLPARPVTFAAVSAVYGTERTNIPFFTTENAPGRALSETATIQLSDPAGIWRPIYARRLALHATADRIVLTAWKADIQGIDLAPTLTAWRQAIGEAADPARDHRRQAAAAAVLGTLAARRWARTRAALATAAKRAHRAGWNAAHQLATRDHADDQPYDDNSDNPYTIGSPDMTDDAADATATATLTAALSATARRAGRAMADAADDPEGDAADAIDSGDDLDAYTDVAISAAYGAGMLAAYLGAGL
ncbi:2'-5' RNA ligase family protein [Streptomyces sp. H10-C2]|uniref:2'-5' RNA ligase family protein n=1 Tax=unclassified Streptomyces TaxID=2593676 RepID=UPI0024B98A21|nr:MULTISPECIES: 2'-5' RNA ligase family protein [unclassified Streptomyces]MDJ0342281.1 2'-5' RNA ligase family protein [Streptomyces sp. PH10-H1]MDJ0368795.1 2'-5' RNA ligase family protein [Streptomyces sp. H10-C2]